MAKRVMVFDLDGTLVDTAPDLLDSLNHCLMHAGLESAGSASLRRFVGYGARVMIVRALEAQQRKLEDKEIDQLFDVFLEHYSANIPGRSAPYPGALEAISRFEAEGYAFAVCTNKYQRLSDALLEGLGIAGHFAAICGADRFSFRKPDPRHLTETILAAGGDLRKSVLIGDSRTDIDTAKAAGMPVVAVDWGYTDVHVSALQPTAVISHFDELTIALADSLVSAETGLTGGAQ